jgi:hypothetical protein
VDWCALDLPLCGQDRRLEWVNEKFPGKFTGNKQINHAKASLGTMKRLQLRDAYFAFLGSVCHFPDLKNEIGLKALHEMTVLLQGKIRGAMDISDQRVLFIETMKFMTPTTTEPLGSGSDQKALLDTFMSSRKVPFLLKDIELIEDGLAGEHAPCPRPLPTGLFPKTKSVINTSSRTRAYSPTHLAT